VPGFAVPAPPEQQVPAHRRARAEREQHACDRQRAVADPAADQEHARAGEQRPHDVSRSAGPGHGHRERAEELQRRRHAEREVLHGRVDEVHPGDRGSERDNQAQRVAVGR
jgi:hypothetical protein